MLSQLLVLQDIYDNKGEGLLYIGYEISESMKGAVLPIVSAILGLLIVSEFIKVIFAEGQVSWVKIFKLLILFYCFQEYEHLVRMVLDLVQGILDKLLNANNGEGITAKGTLDGVITNRDGVGTEVFTDGHNVERTHHQEVDNEFFLITMIKYIMHLWQNMVLIILIATGPIAIMFSFVPGQDNIFTGWARNLVSTSLWSVSFLILDYITMHLNLKLEMYQMTNFDIWDIGTWLKNNGEIIVAKIIFSLGYLLVPTITGKFFGQTASGSFGKQMIATAGGAFAGAKMAFSGAKGVASAARGGNSSQGGAAQQGGGGGNSGGSGGGGQQGGGSGGGGGALGAVGKIGYAIGKASAQVVSGATKMAKNGFDRVNSTEN